MKTNNKMQRGVMKQFFVSILFSFAIATVNVVALDVAQAREPAKADDHLTAPLDAIDPTSSGNPAYQLAMSKNDKLCRHMLQLFNYDLKKYGYVKYDEHEEFKKIPWQEARFFVERQGRTEYTPVQGALFDFNNDGIMDFVIKWTGSLGGRQADSLHMLDSEAAKRADELANKELFESKNKINLSGSFYSLRPPFKVIGGVRILEPFFYDSATYLYMRSLFDAPLAIGEREYAVIVRYHGGTFYDRDVSGKMDDVCYFEHVRNAHRTKD